MVKKMIRFQWFIRKLLKIFKFAQKKIIVIKNGDHSLFKKQFKLKILKELKIIINNYKNSQLSNFLLI